MQKFRKVCSGMTSYSIRYSALTQLLLLGFSSAALSAEENQRITLGNDFNITWQNDMPMIQDQDGKVYKSNLDPELQLKMQAFITERGSPIAAVVVSDIATGKIITMAQGRSPEKWGGSSHTALHSKFPAASLFKTIVTAAALEMTETTADQSFGLLGGCGGQDILPKGEWINDDRGGQMTLRRAYGHSCNSFFAKLAINQLGLGNITRFAHFFGWDQPIQTDFSIEPSKMLAPGAANSTTHTVGRFAAGFGHVGISPVHANWIALAIANKGIPKDLKLFSLDESTVHQDITESPTNAIISSESAMQILNIMKSTVEEGTASNVFGRGRYRSVAQETGGKTGTLMGRTPQGLTTLFMGVYPLSNPQIAVSSVVVLEDHFYFKASQLAAEAIVNWHELQDRKNGIITKKTARYLEPEFKKPRKKRYRRF